MFLPSAGPVGIGLVLASLVSIAMAPSIDQSSALPCSTGSRIAGSPSPGPISNQFSGVVSLSRSDAWAVGAATRVVGNPPVLQAQPLVAHWNNGAWRMVQSPALAGGGSMSSVAAVSPRDLWAVGHQDSTSGGRPLIEHWTGSGWRLVSSTNVNSGYLLGVSAFRADDIWAVGLTLGSVSYSLIEHWNGRRWTVVTSPNPSADYNEIDSVVAISQRSAWAVGFSVSNNASVPMLARWDGSSWTLVASPGTSQPSNVLRSVAAASERNVWAVGQSASGDGSQIQTLVEHWNGRAWSVVGSPSPSSQAWLNAVAVAGDQVLAVGVQVAGFTNQALVVRGAAGQLTVVPSPNRGTGANTLESVAAASEGISWAVGFDQGQTKGESLILRVCSVQERIE